MRDDQLEVLRGCALLRGVDAGWYELLETLSPYVRRYERGEALVLAGYPVERIGVVLSGRIEAERPSPGGGRLILSHMGAGGIIADVLTGSQRVKSPVTVLAATPCEAAWLDARALFTARCDGAGIVLRNWMDLVAEKYFALDRRVGLLLEKRLRARLVQYLRTELVPRANGARVCPFSRTRLAEYLGCDRTALAREITRMEHDGVLRAEGRAFYLNG